MEKTPHIDTPIPSERTGSLFLLRHSWLIHVLVWAIFFSFPFVMISTRTHQTISWDTYLRFTIGLVAMMVVFYANYSFLVEHFLFKKKIWGFLLYNLLLITVVSLLMHLAMEMLPHSIDAMQAERIPPPPRNRVEQGFWNMRMLFGNMTRFVFTAMLGTLFQVTRSWYRVEAARKELEQNRTQAELQNLKSQLNPHFLFNTLNNIYSQIAFSPEKAQESVHELSRLLRYVMYDSSQPFVALESELAFVHNYVELMRIRLPEHVEVKTFIEADTPQAKIAPLLFISLVENAFKHGVSNSHPSFIGINIHQVGDEITCTIINSYYPKETDKDKSGSGIGLSNLRKRLTLLYPHSHTFTYGKEGDNYRAYLSITLHRN
ncbi:sensor histidine kinase YesM [Parabacteroides sp. PFB2-10]|uniref:sensor histidine kinase n=1 Tax=Parabacteroides sp. PFB2-10 TaxID=1742405 RepID=UPI0024765512|nr:histidine kinase [Parabacteroides sp. PFB2-10]MDH6311611.1 sensor histidine kinase YesM [Parabacteroides sp. PFB2-10]